MYIGLDFGTCFSQASTYDEDHLEVLLRNDSYGGVPSAFYYSEEEGILIGGEAIDNSEGIKQSGLVRKIKILLYQRQLEIDVNGKLFSTQLIIEEICKGVLEEAIATAEENALNAEVEGVVIAVPVKFGSFERNVIFNAVNSALQQIYCNKSVQPYVLDVLKEPVAAAISYMKKLSGKKKQVLVYDLGGGTCDIAIVRSTDDRIEQFEVIADDMIQIGGENWDEVLVSYINAELEKQNVIVEQNDSEKIHRAAIKAKLDLSKPSRKQVTIRFPQNGKINIVELTREKFDELTEHLLNQTIEMTKKLVNTAKKEKKIDQLTDIICVGGASRMLQIQPALKNAFPECSVLLYSPEYAVGNGLAIYADMIKGRPIPEPGPEPDQTPHKNDVIKDFAEFSYGTSIKSAVRNGKKVKEVDRIFNLIQKGAPLPAKSKQIFRQNDEEDDYVDFEVFESESMDIIAEPGNETLVGIIRLPRSGTKRTSEKLTMELQLDKSGILDAEVRDENGTKIETEFVFDGESWSKKSSKPD